MADFDMMKEIPGYKAILKSVLKSQIQLLIEQLSEHAGEESIILTASVNDGSLSHLGSSTGKGFFEGRDEIKSQFLGYCLKTFHKQKTCEPPKPYQRKHPSPRTSPSTHANKRYSPYPVHISQPTMSETSQQNAPDTSIRTYSNMDINTGTADGDSYKEIVVKSEIISDDNSSTSVVTSASSATELLPSSIHLTHTQVSNSETNEDSNNTDTYTPDNTVADTAIKVEKEEDELEITGVEMAEQNYDNWGPAQSGYEGETSYTTMPPDQSAYKSLPLRYMCATCGKSFNRRSNLTQHEKKHTGKARFSCCDKLFYSRACYTQHRCRHHGEEKQYKCTTCDRSYSTNARLRRHMRHEQKQHSFQCEICGFLEHDSSKMRDHKSKHSGDKNHECQICGKTYRYRSGLSSHTRKHHKEKKEVSNEPTNEPEPTNE